MQNSRSVTLGGSRIDIKVLFLVTMTILVITALVVAADTWWGIDHHDLMRDPNAIANHPRYFGIISNLGVVLWIASAAVALQAYASLGLKRRGEFSGLLFSGGIFATLMGLDDLFMLHESISVTGLAEPLILLPHALFLAVCCYYAWLMRTETPWLVLGAAIMSFGLSLLFDLYPSYFPGQMLLEEGFKLYGILLFSTYMFLVGHAALRR